MRFDAQVMVFDLAKADSPCYSCLFPEGTEFEEVQCSTMGVLAPLTGVVGAMQAMEAIKLIVGIGESFAARLMVIDAKSGDWRTMKVRRDASCPVCSNR
jgi:adenylyltransferase/sulfurtransferase